MAPLAGLGSRIDRLPVATGAGLQFSNDFSLSTAKLGGCVDGLSRSRGGPRQAHSRPSAWSKSEACLKEDRMADSMHKIIERFPENRDTLRELRDTNSKFEILCEEYTTVSAKLDALAQRNGDDAPAGINALRQRKTAIEEALLSLIEGYSPT